MIKYSKHIFALYRKLEDDMNQTILEKIQGKISEPENGITEYRILQLKETHDLARKRFSSIGQLRVNGMTVDQNDYHEVYKSGCTKAAGIPSLLEEIYEEFNKSNPAGYKGRNLSVSDVIAINKNGKVLYYYVEPIGFKLLEDFSDDAVIDEAKTVD